MTQFIYLYEIKKNMTLKKNTDIFVGSHFPPGF